MVKYYHFKIIILIIGLALILFWGKNQFVTNVTTSVVSNNEVGSHKRTTARADDSIYLATHPKQKLFSLNELGLDLNKEIYKNSSAIYLQIINFAKSHPERILDIWEFSKNFKDDNSNALKAGLLSILIAGDLNSYQEIVSDLSAEEFSALSYSLSYELEKNYKNLSNSTIVDLIKWNRDNQNYKFSLDYHVKKLTNKELIELQLENNVKNIDECDTEIASRISENLIIHSKMGVPYKASNAVAYMYGKLSGAKIFDASHLEEDPMNYLNRDAVIRGAADQIAKNMDASEIVANIEKFDPENIKRIFAYGAVADRSVAAKNISALLNSGINADYPIAGFVEHIVNSSPNLSDDSKKMLESWVDKVQDIKIKQQLLNSVNK